MNTRLISRVLLIGAILVLIVSGCNGSGKNYSNPIFPEEDGFFRGGMHFGGNTYRIFGADDPASDVDLATVVWGSMSHAQDELGTIVVFEDDDPDSSWVVAVGIEDPEGVPNYPVVRFLKSDGSTMSGIFQVPSETAAERECRFPRVDCTYLDNDERQVEVDVAFRYGFPDCSWHDILTTWDVRVMRMIFKYNLNDDWELVSAEDLSSSEMLDSNTGQTTPDIAINQYNGDIYCAWTDLPSTTESHLYYERYDRLDSEWSSFYELKLINRRHSPWFVSLDVGLVSGLPGTLGPVRVVGFAYTGLFDMNWDWPTNYDDLWGFRPVIGYWEISAGDGNHNENDIILVNEEEFDPEDPEQMGDPENIGAWGDRFEAGMIRIEIPSDDATGHGAAVAFMQDTCENSYGDYDAWGISSLYYGWAFGHFYGYIDLSDPDGYDFEMAVFPSLAIHDTDGTHASVTYLARETIYDDWEAWATLWDLDAGSIADPTIIYANASGHWSLALADVLMHDWGSGSSLAVAGANDEYWAAWSNKNDAQTPNEVLGRMGYADP